MDFRNTLLKEVYDSVKNNYTDNYDAYRFGDEPTGGGLKQMVKDKIYGTIEKRNFINKRFYDRLMSGVEEMDQNFSALFELLEDQASRDLLVKIAAYRLLGHKKVKLPLSSNKYWEGLRNVEKLADPNDTINPGFAHFELQKHDLSKIGYDVKLYFTSMMIYTDYVVKQYEYKVNGTTIKAEEGDTVVDGGGCWGDTALYFAHEAGKNGKVHTFEFIPKNIDIMRQNLALNPRIKDRIEIMRHPIWSTSGKELYFVDRGPASQVSFEKSELSDGEAATLSIDDLAFGNVEKKIDYIKLDIEGAEMEALKGAKRTIQTFRPKLAVALYHSLEDFKNIPALIKSYVPEYKFYLGHSTIHHEETILFATVK